MSTKKVAFEDQGIRPKTSISPSIKHLTARESSSGSLSLKGYSEKGNRVGVWTSYTSDGMVDNEEEYKDGERVN